MGTSGWPDFNQFVNECWGWGSEGSSWLPTAINFVFGQNPPYYLDDFLSVYPQFFGPPITIFNTSMTAGSSDISIADTTGLAVGQFMQAIGIFPKGTVITAIAPGTLTVSNQALQSVSNVSMVVWEAPPIPIGIIQIYLNLAAASLVQARWQDSWFIGMAWFIAHYCTLFAKSAARVTAILQASIHGEAPTGAIPGVTYTLSAVPPSGVLDGLYKNGMFQTPGVDYTLVGATVTLTDPTALGDTLRATWATQIVVQTSGYPDAAQLAAQGIANGIQVSKSVGDVSESFTPLSYLTNWGTFNLTIFGQQLAQVAQVMGSGPALIY